MLGNKGNFEVLTRFYLKQQMYKKTKNTLGMLKFKQYCINNKVIQLLARVAPNHISTNPTIFSHYQQFSHSHIMYTSILIPSNTFICIVGERRSRSSYLSACNKFSAHQPIRWSATALPYNLQLCSFIQYSNVEFCHTIYID